MHIQKAIVELGYSAKEAKVYLAVLALGEAHITDIALKVKLPRSSVQVIADKLYQEGLMDFYTARRYKYWVAKNPEHLLQNLKKREENIRQVIPDLTAIMKAGRSISQKKKNSEQQLGALRLVADSSLQPILIASSNDEILYVNAVWKKQFGYTLDEVYGESPRMFKSGKTSSEVYSRMWESLESGKFFQSDAIVDKRKNGTFFTLRTTIFSVIYGSRKFYVQVLDEVTEEG